MQFYHMLKNIGKDNIPFLLREKTIILALNVPGSEISSFNIKIKFKKTLESLRRDKNKVFIQNNNKKTSKSVVT